MRMSILRDPKETREPRGRQFYGSRKRTTGRVAEWLKALLSKSSIPKRYREFESHLFRQNTSQTKKSSFPQKKANEIFLALFVETID
jgi:hypothetical protein